MSSDPTTSEDVKSVHQQCIDTAEVDAALARAELPSGAISEGDARLLAAEVRRLREEKEQALGWHANQVRMIQVLEAKLACVEASSKELIACADQCLEMFEHDDPGTEEYAFAWQVRAAIESVKHALRDE